MRSVFARRAYTNHQQIQKPDEAFLSVCVCQKHRHLKLFEHEFKKCLSVSIKIQLQLHAYTDTGGILSQYMVFTVQ